MGDEPPDEALARSEVIPGLPNSQKDVMSHAIEGASRADLLSHA